MDEEVAARVKALMGDVAALNTAVEILTLTALDKDHAAWPMGEYNHLEEIGMAYSVALMKEEFAACKGAYEELLDWACDYLRGQAVPAAYT